MDHLIRELDRAVKLTRANAVNLTDEQVVTAARLLQNASHAMIVEMYGREVEAGIIRIKEPEPIS